MLLDDRPIPIVQAPLAGGPSTPALTAAVTEAGGFGFLAAGYRTAEQLGSDVADLRDRTNQPFGVNVFVPAPTLAEPEAVRRYARQLEVEAERWGVELGEGRADDDHWQAKLDLLLADPVPLVSFTFGCPPVSVVRDLQARGSEVWVTVTDPDEARQATDTGADGLVVQGLEAGGHRGSFVDDVGAGDLGVVVAVRLVAAASPLPVIAGGGVADGAAMAAVLSAGARGVAVGTAFLRSPEAGTNAAQRRALHASGPTSITRAFTGRRARGITNAFMREHDHEAPSGYPEIHHLTAPLRAAARSAGDADGFNLWAGQGHPLGTDEPAAGIVARFSAEASEALDRAARRLP